MLAIALVLTVGTTLTAKAFHVDIWSRFANWTKDVFLLSDGEEGTTSEQPKKENNLEMKSLQDALTKENITEKLVPMWLPEGYELVECVLTDFCDQKYITATFSNGHTDSVYQLVIYSENTTRKYYKDGTEIWEEEFRGITHTIVRNKNFLVAVWTVDNVECAISIDCQEDEIKRIIKSIYTVEAK